jgi:hypothetical protein
MKISITKPDFSEDTLNKIQIANKKGVKVFINSTDSRDKAYAICDNRTVGKVFLSKEKTIARIYKKHIIEGDLYPLEAILFELVKFYKRRKIRFITE